MTHFRFRELIVLFSIGNRSWPLVLYGDDTLLTRKCRALSSLITGIELLNTRQPALIVRARDTTVTSDLGVSRVPGEPSIYVTAVPGGWSVSALSQAIVRSTQNNLSNSRHFLRKHSGHPATSWSLLKLPSNFALPGWLGHWFETAVDLTQHASATDWLSGSLYSHRFHHVSRWVGQLKCVRYDMIGVMWL